MEAKNGHDPNQKAWLVTAQTMTPNGPATFNSITNTHPALLMLEAQERRQQFLILFFAEIPAEMAQAVALRLQQLNAERSPIVAATGMSIADAKRR